MSRPPNRCVYCGEPGVTKEHFWGAWSRKHALVKFPRNEHILQRYQNLDLDSARTAHKGYLDRPGASRSQTMKIACGKCNRGWMKNNVDAAIPILTRMNYGYWGNITDIESLALRRWIAQFSMSYEFADRDTVMIPQSVRTSFCKKNDLIGEWIIAIGVALPKTGKEPAFHRALARIKPDGTHDPVQITVFMFGMLIAVSIYSSFPTPLTIFSAISDMRLCVIYPVPTKRIIRPTWQHDEESVPIIIEAITSAFRRSVESQSSS